MTETDYEHECMRAELLGIDKPSREEFFSRKIDKIENENDESENWSTHATEELHHQGEGINRASGGLDELNSILSVTQKKINHLKTVCGSFTRILKLHSYANKEDASTGSNETFSTAEKFTDDSSASDQNDKEDKGDEEASETIVHSKKPAGSDIQSAVDSQLSKLDSLISKAERADISLSSQNKQMKKFLK